MLSGVDAEGTLGRGELNCQYVIVGVSVVIVLVRRGIDKPNHGFLSVVLEQSPGIDKPNPRLYGYFPRLSDIG